MTYQAAPGESFVYVIGPAVGPQKIGISRDPQRRLEDIQVGTPFAILIQHAEPAMEPIVRRAERLAHAALLASRQRGEWFNVPVITAIGAVRRAVADAALGADAPPARVHRAASATELPKLRSRLTPDGLVAAYECGALTLAQMEAGLAYREAQHVMEKAGRPEARTDFARIVGVQRLIYRLEGEIVRAAGLAGLKAVRSVAYRAELADAETLRPLSAALSTLARLLDEQLAA